MMVETTKRAKLTTPQANALADLLDGPKVWGIRWPPGDKLVTLGFATRKPRGLTTYTFTITDAGRAHPAVAQA